MQPHVHGCHCSGVPTQSSVIHSLTFHPTNPRHKPTQCTRLGKQIRSLMTLLFRVSATVANLWCRRRPLQVGATPEDSGLSGEDRAECFRADKDGDVVHAVRVVAAVEHPGGAGRERLLTVRQLRPKRQRAQLVVPLHTKRPYLNLRLHDLHLLHDVYAKHSGMRVIQPQARQGSYF